MSRRLMILVAVWSILGIGCAGHRSVQTGNIFVNSQNPSIQIQVDTTLKSLGEVNFQTTAKGGDWADTLYFQAFPFVETDQDNRVTKAVMIDFVTTRTSSTYFKWTVADTIEMLCNRDFNFQTGKFSAKQMQTYLGQSGLKIDGNYAGSIWNRTISPSEVMQIIYFEIIPPTLLWASPQEQQDFLKDLKSRATETFTVVQFDLF